MLNSTLVVKLFSIILLITSPIFTSPIFAQEIPAYKNKNIPTDIDNLIALKGIGRKSANVILRETSQKAQGIIADLHVIRVAPRIGITDDSKDGIKIEKQLMKVLPTEIWNEIGMAISFLGREICRPTNPKCNQCIIQKDCQYTFKTV